jgi:glycosyltransferase involved in cell wall biosynthesis
MYPPRALITISRATAQLFVVAGLCLAVEHRDVRAAVHVGNPPQRDASYYARILNDPLAARIPIIFCANSIELAFNTIASQLGTKIDGHTVYNAIDYYCFADTPKRDRPFSARGKFIVGMTGRFVEYKDHATLIRACARVPGVQLWLAGSGDLGPSLRALADEVRTDTWWIGDVPPSEIPRFLRALDLFFFATTWREGFSLSLLEAMASGCLIAASDVPSCQEVLGGDVRLVKPTVDGYVRALESAMDLGAPARALSIHATQGRARQFDVGPFVKSYREILGL